MPVRLRFQAQARTAGAYGTFTLGTNGVWTYTASNSNPAVQALGAGQTLTETFTVTFADGTTSTVVVTINGTNDAAVISAGTGSVTEDVGVVGGNIATGGTLTVTDVDTGQASFQAQASTAGTYGTFTLGTNGAWTYTASNTNPAVQALGAGQTLTETFTVRSTDGTTSTVVVTINGTNDAAVISAGTGAVTEDVGVVGGNIATGGTLTVTDTDAGQAQLPGSGLHGGHLRHLHAGHQRRLDLHRCQHQPGHPGARCRSDADRDLHRSLRPTAPLRRSSSRSTAPTMRR